MRQSTLTLLLTILLFFFGEMEVKADHFAGSDLTYTCLGGNTYLITVAFYRDCAGIPAPSNVNVAFNCSSTPSFNFNSSIQRIPLTGQEITNSCSAYATKCDTGNIFGVQEYIYQGQVTLAPCNSWTMSYSGCCRNPITTIPNGTTTNWYMSASLNNLNAPCNSSPTFSNKPVAIVCNNQSFCFNHGAIDDDGDSLVYSFYAPNKTANTNVSYLGSWSQSNFLTALTPPGITLDPVTGDLCFTPIQSLTTIVGIKVEEYRNINGVATLIGTVHRDIQMKVVHCNNNIPTLSGMDTTLSGTYNPNDTIYRLDICLSNDPIIFDINGFDADTFDPGVIGSPEKFSITWNSGIPSGSFTTYNNGTDSAYANFTWLPTKADVGNIKCFTATITDDACPYNGYQTFSYCILVRGMLINIGTDTLLCEGETLTVVAEADTTTVNYLWSINGIPTGTPQSQDWLFVDTKILGDGLHTISIETNDGNTTTACPGIDEKLVNVIYQPHINNTLLDSAFCQGNSITYDAGKGTQYTWADISNNPLGASQNFTTSNSGVYIVIVNGGFNTRCFDIDTFEVISIDYPKLGSDTCIWSEDSPFTLDAGVIPNIMNYKWNDGSTGQTIDVSQSGKYTVTVHHNTISTSVGCIDEQIVNVIDKDNMILSAKIQANEDIELEEYQAGDREICSHQRLKIKGPLAPNGHKYTYDWIKDGIVVSSSPIYIFSNNNINSSVIELNAGGCLDEIEVTTINCDVIVPNIITPNGDGYNDQFKIKLKNSDEDFYYSFPSSSLIIYNRWGAIVYESNNYQNTWGGNDVTDGVYFWSLELNDGKGTLFQGTVTLISK